jgi:hypothetical protein
MRCRAEHQHHMWDCACPTVIGESGRPAERSRFATRAADGIDEGDGTQMEKGMMGVVDQAPLGAIPPPGGATEG